MPIRQVQKETKDKPFSKIFRDSIQNNSLSAPPHKGIATLSTLKDGMPNPNLNLLPTLEVEAPRVTIQYEVTI
jgi:hypothetical protein